MTNMLSYYKKRKEILMREIESRGLSVDAKSRGGCALLQVLLGKNDVLQEKSSHVFKVMSTKNIQNTSLDGDSDDSCNTLSEEY